MAIVNLGREPAPATALTEGSIQDLLENYFSLHSRDSYLARNIFVFDWESDYFLINKRGYTTEIEIKISKSDFKRDFEKVAKHSTIKTGSCTKETWGGLKTIDSKGRRPNRFYYCMPDGLVPESEIPEYAGLIYIKKDSYIDKYYVTIIKDAPLIHKEKFNYDKILMVKFYYYWKNSIREIEKLTKKLNKLTKGEDKCLKD